MLPFGISDHSGMIIHISEVESGLKCGCICPSCKDRLVARKGTIKTHHFAHFGNSECTGSFESALHQFAKSLIEKTGSIRLPKLEASYGSYSKLLAPEQNMQFDHVHVETRVGNIVPDLIGVRKNRDLLIEFAVSHFCDEKKIKKIEKIGLSTLEIDLSEIAWDADLKEIENQILISAKRYWVFNSLQAEAINQFKVQTIEDIAANEAHEKRANDKTKKMVEREFNSRIDAIRSAIKRITSMSYPNPPALNKQSVTYTRLNKAGLVPYANFKTSCNWGFSVSRDRWQGEFLCAFVLYPIECGRTGSAFTTNRAIEWVQTQNFLHHEFENPLSEKLERKVRQTHSNFRRPYLILKDYLFFLKKEGFIIWRRGRWRPNFQAFMISNSGEVIRRRS